MYAKVFARLWDAQFLHSGTPSLTEDTVMGWHYHSASDKFIVMVLVTQSCLTLCDPTDGSPPGSSVHGILQARILGWVAIFFSRGSSWFKDQTQVSCMSGRFFTVWATREAWQTHKHGLQENLAISKNSEAWLARVGQRWFMEWGLAGVECYRVSGDPPDDEVAGRTFQGEEQGSRDAGTASKIQEFCPGNGSTFVAMPGHISLK